MNMKRLFSFTGLSDKENDRTALSVDQKLKEVQKNSGVLSFRNTKSPADVKKLLGNESIGHGSFGTVTKRFYKETPIAVKSLTRTVDNEAMFRTLMDLDVVNKSIDCPQIVKCYGYFITDVEVLICMEFMDTCLDRLLKEVEKIPEEIIGNVNGHVLKALHYLKEKHKIIHRDIKPSNVLLNKTGKAKLCDFGISRELIESVALSNQGCKPYMAPERLSKPDEPYGIQSDVWSLGITLVELATGTHPYDDGSAGKSDPCAMMFRVMYDDPPRLQTSDGFSQNFCHFTAQCLQHEPTTRPKYDVLLQHPFVTQHLNESGANVQKWVSSVI